IQRALRATGAPVGLRGHGRIAERSDPGPNASNAMAHGQVVITYDRSFGSAFPTGLEARMSVMSLLLNLLWILFGGLWMALGWAIAAVIMAITIIGLPWARAAFSIAIYTLLPFGQRAVS